jgi:hypothetical protein
MKAEGREMNKERKMPKRIMSVRDLNAYRLAFDTAMEIFELSKTFPPKKSTNIFLLSLV